MPNRTNGSTDRIIARVFAVSARGALAVAALLMVAPVFAEAPAPQKPAAKKAPAKQNAPAKKKAAENKKKMAERANANAEKPATAAAAAPDSSSRGGDATVPRPKGPVNIPTQKDPDTGDTVLVISNDSLENIFGPPPEQQGAAYFDYDVPAEGAAAAAPSKNGPPKQDADKRIAQIENDLERLRANRLRIRNPLLRRPDVTKEEAAEQEGMDNVERLRATDAQIAALEAELAELRSGPSRSGGSSSGGSF